MSPLLQNRRPQSGFVYLLIIALLIGGLYLILQNNTPLSGAKKVPLNKVIEQVKSGTAEEIRVEGSKMIVTLVDGSKEVAYKERGSDIYQILENTGVSKEQIAGVAIDVSPSEGKDFWLNLLLSILPFLFIVGFFIFMMRSAQSSSNQALGFGRSQPKVYDKTKSKTTFEDVAGCEEAKQELVEIVDFLKNPAKYTTMGAKIPKGVLLLGAPGTGKTLLARAVAGEADVPFFSISGSEFVEMFVGVGASRVRDLFKRAKSNAPCIVFIDEIDAVGRHRGAGLGGGHDEREQTLNQILVEMDGFDKETKVIIIAATNRPDVLDPALLRPGRFDRRIVVDMPDIRDREMILKVHARGKPMEKSASLHSIARQTPGFTGADLENLMNEAAILAARNNKKALGMKELEQSIEKVMLGPERRSRVLSKKEKEITAFHEVGHALVAHLRPNCDPVHKISIVSRGMALGVTWMVPEEDKKLLSRSKFEDEMCAALGGYASEEIFFNDITTGASDDLEKATNIARKMVTQFGMSTIGPVIMGERNQEVFLGRDFMHMRNYSEETAAKIDAEVKKFVDQAYRCAKETLAKHKSLVEEIARDLIEKETISRKEFLKYFPAKEDARADAQKV